MATQISLNGEMLMQSNTVIKRFESLPKICAKDATHSYIRDAYPTTELLGANKNGKPDDGKLSCPVWRAVHGCSLEDIAVPTLPYRHNDPFLQHCKRRPK